MSFQPAGAGGLSATLGVTMQQESPLAQLPGYGLWSGSAEHAAVVRHDPGAPPHWHSGGGASLGAAGASLGAGGASRGAAGPSTLAASTSLPGDEVTAPAHAA